MTAQTTLKPGGSVVYSTRPTGLNTCLFSKSAGGEAVIKWHIELCCQPDHRVEMQDQQPVKTDVSSGAGALMTVRNDGFNNVVVWTDY